MCCSSASSGDDDDDRVEELSASLSGQLKINDARTVPIERDCILEDEDEEEKCRVSWAFYMIQNSAQEASSDEEFPRLKAHKHEHCKVFMESEDVGRTLDLSTLRSYEELNRKLASMFIGSNISSNVVYSNTAGTTKHVGDEPFSEFVMKARRLTILTDSSRW